MFYNIVVHKDYQSKGIGKMIMNNLLAFTKDKKYSSISLFADLDNKDFLIPFYNKFGFKLFETGSDLKNKLYNMERHKETIKVEVVAGVVIKQDGKYLLVQEKQPRAYGLWNWPAGKIDVGESIEQAAIRETKEESGYDVELTKEIVIFHAEAADTIKHVFEGKIIGGQLDFPADEILDARWFMLDEIKQMADKLRGKWILETISILENK